MVSVAYHLSRWASIESICFIFVNPQNNIILDMSFVSIILKIKALKALEAWAT